MNGNEPIPTQNSIELYLHCAKCIREKPSGISPQDWQMTQTGFTKMGIQVWCLRHDCNIVHISFDGVKHRANRSN